MRPYFMQLHSIEPIPTFFARQNAGLNVTL
jgi:hypothetical protein